MKKRLMLTLVALGVGLNSGVWAASSMNRVGALAPDRVGKWDLGIGIAASMNDKTDDSSFVYSQVSYGVTPYIGLGVEAGWQEADLNGTSDETIGAVPILFDIIIRVPTVHEAFVPYGILGLGVAGVYDTDENGAGNNNGDDTDDIGFAWKLGAGFDWFINSNWIFNFEFAYWSADVQLVRTAIDDGYDWWTAGVALKYVF